MYWIDPGSHSTVTHDRAPVMIQIRYKVASGMESSFLLAM